MVEDSHKAQITLMTSRERFSTLTTEIASLEARLLAMKQDLESKKNLVRTAEKEVDEMSRRIKMNEEKKAGLCIR